MIVIAVTCEIGSRGADVIAGLAVELSLDIVDHGLLSERISQRSGVVDRAAGRVPERCTLAWDRRKFDSICVSRVAAHEIMKFAAGGNVIIHSMGAVQLLTDVPHAICVHVSASIEDRIDELVSQADAAIWEMTRGMAQVPDVVRERMIVNRSEARRQIEVSDRQHAKLVSKKLREQPLDRTLYDIVLNSSIMSAADCVLQVRDLLQDENYRCTENSVKRLSERLLSIELAQDE